MVKHLFIYGVLLNSLNHYACKVQNATAYGMKLTIHKTLQIPSIITTYDLHDYVNGNTIKVCNPNKMSELLVLCDQIAFGFDKKIIQVNIGNKKVDAYAYFPQDMSMYEETDFHTYSEYKSDVLNK